MIETVNINMSFYMIVNSNGNSHYFPSNKPYHFKTRLQPEQSFPGLWKVALISIFTNKQHIQPNKQIYIYSSVCGESIVDGEMRSLLRLANSDTKGILNKEFSTLMYVNVNKSDISEIEFYIRDEQFNVASFLTQPLTVTLHFKSYPFLF